MQTVRNIAVLLFIVATLQGCVSAKYGHHFEERFFWPPLGLGEPKIEYIDYYISDDDIIRDRGVSWFEEMLGVAKPLPLFERPVNVVSDGKGRVYVSDIDKKTILILDYPGKQIRYLKGPDGRPYYFGFSFSLTLTAAGEIIVSDGARKRIFWFNANERLVKEFEDKERFGRVAGMAYDDERSILYVSNSQLHKVFVYDREGNLVRELGSRGTGNAEFNFPLDVDLDTSGNLYVLDSMNFKVKVFSPEGEFLRSFGGVGTLPGAFQLPKGIAVSPSGLVYVTDSRKHSVIIFDLEGRYLFTLGKLSPKSFSGLKPGGFYMPTGIDVDDGDAIWLADTFNKVLHRFQYLTNEYKAEHPLDQGKIVIMDEFRDEQSE